MDDTQQKETRRRIKVCLDALISELKSRGFKVTRKDENTLVVNGMTFTATDQLSDTYNDVCYLLTDYQQMIECTLSRISECADTIIELLDVQLEKGGKMKKDYYHNECFGLISDPNTDQYSLSDREYRERMADENDALNIGRYDYEYAEANYDVFHRISDSDIYNALSGLMGTVNVRTDDSNPNRPVIWIDLCASPEDMIMIELKFNRTGWDYGLHSVRTRTGIFQYDHPCEYLGFDGVPDNFSNGYNTADDILNYIRNIPKNWNKFVESKLYKSFGDLVTEHRNKNKGIKKSSDREDLLREQIDRYLRCAPAEYKEFWWGVSPISDKTYRLSYEGTDYGLNLVDDIIRVLPNYDFKLVEHDPENRLMTIEDALDNSRNLRNEMVLIVVTGGGGLTPLEMTLGEAIERYGIQSEGDPNDYRLFARCPRLNNLCGPMYPNDGFIARYESWSAYDILSR